MCILKNIRITTAPVFTGASFFVLCGRFLILGNCFGVWGINYAADLFDRHRYELWPNAAQPVLEPGSLKQVK